MTGMVAGKERDITDSELELCKTPEAMLKRSRLQKEKQMVEKIKNLRLSGKIRFRKSGSTSKQELTEETDQSAETKLKRQDSASLSNSSWDGKQSSNPQQPDEFSDLMNT